MKILPTLLSVVLLLGNACGENPLADNPTDTDPPAGVSGFLNSEPDIFTIVPALSGNLGPWLTWIRGDATGTHMVVSWGRTMLHQPVFFLGTSPGQLTNMAVTNSVLRRKHSFVCENLFPGTVYYYRVDDVAGSNLIPESVFRTAPAAGQPFRFIYTSDTRPKTTDPLDDNEAVATGNALAADPAAADAVFSINAGDIVDRGRAQDWRAWMIRHWKGVLAKWPVLPACGNHDYDTWNTSIGTTQSYFKDIFSLPGAEWFYRMDFGRTRFLTLDTGWTTLPKAMDLSFRSGQLAFLDAELAQAATDKAAGSLDFLFIIMHKGIGNCSNHGQDDDIISLRAQLRDRFNDSVVDVVLQSHEHSWQRNSMDGIVYLNNGTGGSWAEGENGERLMDRAAPGLVNHHFNKIKGYALIDVNGKNLTITDRSWQFVDLDTSHYRLVTVTYRNPRGWTNVRMRYANAFQGTTETWTSPVAWSRENGRPMRTAGDGSFRITVPVMRHESGEYRMLCSFNNGEGEIDDNFGDCYATAGDEPDIAGSLPGPLTVLITSPINDASFINGRQITVSGTAMAEPGDSISGIQLSVNGGPWDGATGTATWSATVRLAPGITNTLRARAFSLAGHTNTSAIIRIGHSIVPLFTIDGTKEPAWNDTAIFTDAADNAGSVPLNSLDMNLTTLHLTNDGYFLYTGWDLGTNSMQAGAIWYLAIETGTPGGATNMAGFGQSSYSMLSSWSGVDAPDLMAFFKYKTTANGGLNGFWVSTAADGSAVHPWDTTGAVVNHATRWTEARIPLSALGLSNNQTIRCWLAVSKSDNANRAILDNVPRLGAEWPHGGSWTASSPQYLASDWGSYTLQGVEVD